MHVTRRYWTVVALIVLLGAWALLVAQPSVLAGAIVLGAWLLASQYTYISDLESTLDELTIELTTSRDRLIADEACTLTLTAQLNCPTPLTVGVSVPPPVGIANLSKSLSIELDKLARATTATAVEWPIAGTFRIGPPMINATDKHGLFRTTLDRGPTTTMTVDPQQPHNIQLRGSGSRFGAALGEHETDHLGAGIQPAEIRSYQPGDAVRHIDWKATARLDDVHVRDFEVETDRTTALVVDHRSSMAEGTAGETKLDYARHVALSIADSAYDTGDPLGLYTIGEGGLTNRQQPRSDQQTYLTIRTTLSTLDPTAPPKNGVDRPAESMAYTDIPPLSPARARDTATQLTGDESEFGQILAPYYEAATPYIQRIEREPLFRTVRSHIAQLSGPRWTVIITDETKPTELREAVKLARSGDNHVLVALTPSALFQESALTDLNAAHERYVEFENVRRDLDGLARVTAIEIAPGERLASVLAAGDNETTLPEKTA